MASGKQHDRATVATASVIAVATFALSQDPLASLVAAIGTVSGIFLTPDLDQESINGSEWAIIRHTFGLGFLWVMFWYPYAVAFKHRSFYSHFPVVSTLIRVLYLLIPLVVSSLWFDSWKLLQSTYWLWWVGGLCFSDLVHWALDGLPLNL